VAGEQGRFPNLTDLIVVVVDGATPEIAARSAGELSALLSREVGLFRSVRQPEGGSFFDHNGLLFLPLSEVETITAQLIHAQPFLGPVATDPSLRGVTTSLSTALDGIEEGEAKLADIAVPMRRFADTLGAIVTGKDVFFSWQTLMSGNSDTRETRRFIVVQPALNHEALVPGARATDAIRRLAQQAGLGSPSGVRIRVTGPVVLADEEFSTLTDHVAAMTAATVAAVLLMLWFAVRSIRIVGCDLDFRRSRPGDGTGPSCRWPLQLDFGGIHTRVRRLGCRFRHPVQRPLPRRAHRLRGC